MKCSFILIVSIALAIPVSIMLIYKYIRPDNGESFVSGKLASQKKLRIIRDDPEYTVVEED